MTAREGKCTNKGNCSTANDNKIVQVDAGREFACPECRGALYEAEKAGPSRMPAILAAAAIVAVAGVLGFMFKDKLMSALGMGTPPADARVFSYAIQAQRGEELTLVDAKHAFRKGDRFRLLVKSTDPAYLYIFNANQKLPRVIVLYPDSATRAGAKIDADSRVQVPQGDSAWMRMDENPGTEEVVFVASPVELKQFQSETYSPSEFKKEMDNLGKTAKVSQSTEGDWTKVAASSKDDTAAIVTRVKLEHR
jgi:hypothetical protein